MQLLPVSVWHYCHLQLLVSGIYCIDTKQGECFSLANSDYVPFVEHKTFSANTAEMVISVRIINDLIVERDETFKVVLQDPGKNVVIGEHNETTITIINDDCESQSIP